MDIMIRTTVRAGMPVLEMWRQDMPDRQPLVVVQHGYLGRKEFVLPQAYLMAASGFFTVVTDAWQHGENNPSPRPNLLVSTRRTAEQLNGLLSSYVADNRADASRAGYIGYSMGGMIGFYYLTLPEVRFKALCPVIGSPDWESVAQAPEVRRGFDEVGLGTEDDWQALLREAREGSPMNKTFATVPLLIQNGDADPLIPIAGVTRFVEQMKGRYDHSDDLQLIVYPGQGHADTVEMNQRAVAFLLHHLQK